MNSIICKILILLLFVCVGCFSGYSQSFRKEANVWYFGTNAGLDFNTHPPTALTNGAMQSYEGCASYCDSNGNILFYTEGTTVYNKQHAVMQNGTGLMGHIGASQAAIFVPYPGADTLYYVFTVDANEGSGRGLRYSIINTKLDYGNGAITNVKNKLLYTATREKLMAARHGNGRDFWVIVQQQLTNNYRAYHVTDTGIVLPPVISSVGAVSSGWYMLRVSPQGDKIATNHAQNPPTLNVFDFDNNTGVLSNPITLNTPQNLMEIFGLEFSSNGQVLYCGVYNNTRPVYQWNLNAWNENAINNSRVLIDTGSAFGMGTFQLAPDGKIYIAREGRQYLSVINNPNVLGTGCDFQSNGISLGSRVSRYGLPAFIPDFIKLEVDEVCIKPNANFISDTVCLNELTTLTSTSTIDSGIITKYWWDLGDGNQKSDSIVTHQYTSSGLYTVTLIIESDMGCKDTMTKVGIVVVRDLPKPDFSSVKTIEGESNISYQFTNLSTGQQPLSFNWKFDSYGISTDSDPEFEFTDTGKMSIKLEVKDMYGCTDSIEQILVVYKNIDSTNCHNLTSEFSVDTVCYLDITTLFSKSTIDSGNFTNHMWDLGDGNQKAGSLITHQYASPGLYTITLIVESDMDCRDTMTKVNIVLVRDLPTPNFSYKIIQEDESKTEFQFTNLSNGQEPLSYFWQFDNNGSSIEKNPRFEFIDTGKMSIKLEAEDIYGCKKVIEKTIFILLSGDSTVQKRDFFMPSAFSPNGDGLNDFFNLEGFDYVEDFTLKMFNRWGEEIFSTTDFKRGWDGTYMGLPVPQGTYIYLIQFYDKSRHMYLKNGMITLMR